MYENFYYFHDDDKYLDDLRDIDIQNDKDYEKLLHKILEGVLKMMDQGNPIHAGIGLYSVFELMLVKSGVPPCQILVNWQYFGDLGNVDHKDDDEHIAAMLDGRLNAITNFTADTDGISDNSIDKALSLAGSCIRKLELLGEGWTVISDDNPKKNNLQERMGVWSWARVMFAAASWARGWGGWFGSSNNGKPIPHSPDDVWKCATTSSAFATCCDAPSMQTFLRFNLDTDM